MEKINVKWNEAMAFTASVGDFQIPLDAAAEHGGNNTGMRPKPLMLVALAGCTAMDIASLSKKMRVSLESFEVEVEAQKSETMPIVYTSFLMVYKVKCSEDDREKVEKMVKGSQEKYCGVSAMLAKVAPIEYRIDFI